MKTRYLIALAATSLLATPAMATTHILTLTGQIANTTFNMFDIPNIGHFRTGTLLLDPFTPFTIVQGDTIQATITLDGAFIVPASGEQLFGINFNDDQGGSPSFILLDTVNSGTTTFSYSAGPTNRLNGDVAPGGCSNCLSNITGQVPGPAFRFDQLFLTESIDALEAPFTIGQSTISYQLREPFNAIPEPAAWALMLTGFGLVGSAMRRRAKVAVTYA